ncbi:hypothetical protein HanPSC8_Chr11g0484111 [Helianthus annuus]|nr:hypothetical protein HanPSC8_Chr11g0484111 [Helianthus annuus]
MNHFNINQTFNSIEHKNYLHWQIRIISTMPTTIILVFHHLKFIIMSFPPFFHSILPHNRS